MQAGFLTLERFASLSGISADEMYRHIQEARWVEGTHFIIKADGQILMDLQACDPLDAMDAIDER